MPHKHSRTLSISLPHTNTLEYECNNNNNNNNSNNNKREDYIKKGKEILITTANYCRGNLNTDRKTIKTSKPKEKDNYTDISSVKLAT